MRRYEKSRITIMYSRLNRHCKMSFILSQCGTTNMIATFPQPMHFLCYAKICYFFMHSNGKFIASLLRITSTCFLFGGGKPFKSKTNRKVMLCSMGWLKQKNFPVHLTLNVNRSHLFFIYPFLFETYISLTLNLCYLK